MELMKRFSIVLSSSALVAALALSGERVRAEDAKCGGKAQPDCPLQGWMEKHMQVPFEAKDLGKLADALAKAAKLAPDPKWNEGDNGWAKIANDAAAAAKAGNFEAVQQACKACHKAWRRKYKKEHRPRPISP
jgi:hypothetical protein